MDEPIQLPIDGVLDLHTFSPREIKDLFHEWLYAHFPDRATRVMSIVRQMRNGRDYDPEWGKRQKGEGPYAKLIADRFTRAMRRFGLDKPRLPLDTTQFRRPLGAGGQADLFYDAAEPQPARAAAEEGENWQDK